MRLRHIPPGLRRVFSIDDFVLYVNTPYSNQKMNPFVVLISYIEDRVWFKHELFEPGIRLEAYEDQ